MEPTDNLVSVKFVGSRFSLPLFLLSRNHIKQSRLKPLTNHIQKKSNLYNKNFVKDFENITSEFLQRIADKDNLPSIANKYGSNAIRKWSPKPTNRAFQLPPTLYNVTKIPYEVKRGDGGAHWRKTGTHQSKHRPAMQHSAAFYNLEIQKMSAPCNNKKGYFLSNARERRATTRCMVDCITTCYRIPADPGPATYSPAQRKPEKFQILESPNPHIFYSSSSVPQKKNVVHYSHTSFTAAPGRYETSYPKSCPCSSRLIYFPRITLLIDKEKRNKFRTLPYEKIKAHNYTSPDWKHVKGQGFRYLFMGATRPPQSKKFVEQNVKKQKNLKLYPDSKYIALINNPARTPLSFRASPIRSLKPRIRFNCTSKTIVRRHLKVNKKTAFGSSQERFEDSFRMPVLTMKQREKLKQTLPLERQLCDRPVTKKRLSEINSKLTEIPDHMLPTYVPSLRKKMFKFPPLPQTTVLVTENETTAKIVDSEGFYLRPLDTKHFFKTDANK